jgi:hypothetical protein
MLAWSHLFAAGLLTSTSIPWLDEALGFTHGRMFEGFKGLLLLGPILLSLKVLTKLTLLLLRKLVSACPQTLSSENYLKILHQISMHVVLHGYY